MTKIGLTDDRIKQIESDMKKTAGILKEKLEKEPNIEINGITHNDCDGIASRGILESALKREKRGLKINYYYLERSYQNVIEKILKEKEGIIIISDFGAQKAKRIEDINNSLPKKNLVICIDHHIDKKPAAAFNKGDGFYPISCGRYGIYGDCEASAATLAFGFAMALNYANVDLSRMAVVGQYGDGLHLKHSVDGEQRRFIGYALDAFHLAQDHGMSFDYKRGYVLSIRGREMPLSLMTDYLDCLMSVGYHDDEAREIALALLDAKDIGHIPEKINKLDELKKEIFENEKTRSRKTDYWVSRRNTQFFDVEDRFAPMGVKTVGLYAGELADKHTRGKRVLIEDDKYVIGAQNISEEVPGLGRAIEPGKIKVSVRTPYKVRRGIETGKLPEVFEIMKGCVKSHELGSCHAERGACDIDRNDLYGKGGFLDRFEEYTKDYKKANP